jgi:serine/threonine protein kinase
MIGTSYYMAPELIKEDGGRYGQEVDVWALGLVFYEMLTG